MSTVELTRRNVVIISVGGLVALLALVVAILALDDTDQNSLSTESELRQVEDEATAAPTASNLATDTALSEGAEVEPESEFAEAQEGAELVNPDTDRTEETRGQSTSTLREAPNPQPSPANPGAEVFEPLRNTNPLFSRQANTPSNLISLSSGLIPADRPDNGSGNGTAAFRLSCSYSHFNYDDPIIFPGQPGKAHLHMFFGNTEADAYSTQDSLVNSGGGSCQGQELNRSAYWTPALLDGNGNVVVPDDIIIYYKTKRSNDVERLPQGLQMVAGNVSSNSFDTNQYLRWACGGSGTDYGHTNRIPDCGGDTINAAIAFPNCWNGVLKYDESNFAYSASDQPCPSGHPRMFPQITILIYYPGTSSIDGWHISSDGESYRDGNYTPGGTLHADWFGGWNEEAMDLFIDGCMKAHRNCSQGQTGTSNAFSKTGNNNSYPGENFLKLPAGSYTPH